MSDCWVGRHADEGTRMRSEAKKAPRAVGGTASERMSDDDVQLIASVAHVPAAKVRVIVDLAEKRLRERMTQ